eukprot:4652763-Pleurochrysis_carterae.AAC.1
MTAAWTLRTAFRLHGRVQGPADCPVSSHTSLAQLLSPQSSLKCTENGRVTQNHAKLACIGQREISAQGLVKTSAGRSTAAKGVDHRGGKHGSGGRGTRSVSFPSCLSQYFRMRCGLARRSCGAVCSRS